MIPQEQPSRTMHLKSRLLPIFVIVLVVLQLFFPYKGWVILITGFGGLWLLSFLWARSLLKGLQIERELRFGWKQVGDRLRERILLRNNSWAPSLWVEVVDHSDMSEYDISSVSDVRGYRHRSWHTQGFCDTRGLYTLGPVTLNAQDPFGIYQVTVDYTNSVNMMVAPPVIALPEIEIASGGRVGEGRSSNKGVEQTINTVGVREYVPGDSLRFLHWPTTARMGDLYVHLFDNEPSSDWWVVLDMDAEAQVGEGARSTEEHGIVLAASLINSGLQRGKHVGLVTYGDDLIWHPPDLGNAHLWAILRSLAAIRPGGPSLDQILFRLRSSLEQNSSLVVITANLSLDWINALEIIRRSGIVPTVLLMDPVSFGGTGNLEAFRSRLRKLGITHYIISADMLDQPQKRPQGLRWLIEQTRLRGDFEDKWEERKRKMGRFVRTWGLLIAFFVVVANLLEETVRGLDLNLIWFLIVGGMVVGWLLAKSPLPGWLATLLSAVIGLFYTVLRVGRLWTPLWNVITQAVEILNQAGTNLLRDAGPVDLQPLQSELADFWDGLSGLAERLWGWMSSILSAQSFYDPVAITIVWSLALWGTVVWAMWGIFRRKKPLPAFLPAIGLVTISLALSGQTNYDLIFLLGATLALMAFVNHEVHERAWLREKLSFTPTIRNQIFVMASLLTLALMIISLLTPTLSINYLKDLARKVTGTAASDRELVRSFGIQSPVETKAIELLDIKREGGLPNEHLIGSSSKLSEQVVMVVRVDASQSGIPEDQLAEVLSPLYLRSLVYDRYVGSGWSSRDTEVVQYAPGDVLPVPKSNAGRPIRQQVQFVDDGEGLLYTLGTPLSVDQDFKIAWRVQNDTYQAYDILGGTVSGDTYRADSLVQIHSIDELRSAGQNYPGWITSRFMSLPDSVPEDVLTLARDLTATEANPYDRAVAIETYLRQFPYNLNVSTGPAGADITEYFLFFLKEGYCDYYATAMVVLARAAGMPARYVAGYIGEHYDPELDAYVITADEAHAWAEIYFPGYGWIQFEPTGGRAPIKRPPEILPELPENLQLDFSPLVQPKKFSFDQWPSLLGIVVLLGLVLIILSWLISDWYLARRPIAQLLPKLFRRLYRYGSWMGFPPRPGQTPYEFSHLLNSYITQLSTGCYWVEWLSLSTFLLQRITDAYVGVTFNPQSRAIGDQRDLMRFYKLLRPRLWLIWLLGRVHRYSFLHPFFWTEAPLMISLHVEDEL